MHRRKLNRQITIAGMAGAFIANLLLYFYYASETALGFYLTNQSTLLANGYLLLFGMVVFISYPVNHPFPFRRELFGPTYLGLMLMLLLMIGSNHLIISGAIYLSIYLFILLFLRMENDSQIMSNARRIGILGGI